MINYFDFDYTDETAVAEQVEKIRTEISKAFGFEIEDSLKVVNEKTNKFDEAVKEIFKKEPDNWETLSECSRAKIISNEFSTLYFDIYQKDKNGDIKYNLSKKPIIDKAVQKKNTELATKYYNSIKNLYEEHKSYKMFLLIAASYEKELMQKTKGAEKERHTASYNIYTNLAKTEFDINYILQGSYERIVDTFDLSEDYSLSVNDEATIKLLIAFSRAELKKAQFDKSNFKNKLKSIFSLSDRYDKLTSGQNRVTNVREIIEAKINAYKTEIVKQEAKKSDIYNRINDLSDDFLHESLSILVEDEKYENSVDGFFEDKDLSDDEKIKHLDLLESMLYLTRNDIKNYLVNDHKELVVSKVPGDNKKNDKIEIKISSSFAADKEFYLSKSGSTNEKTILGAEKDISYVFNPYTYSIDSIKIGSKVYSFKNNYNKEFTDNISLDLKTFIGNLENEFNINIISAFTKNVPLVTKVKTSANLAKGKEVLKIKTKNNFVIEQNAEINAGNVSITGFRIKPSIVSLNAGLDITKDNRKLSTSFKNTLSSIDLNNGFSGFIASIKENLDKKVVLNFFTCTLDKDERCLSSENSSLFAIPFKNENGRWIFDESKGVDTFFKDECGRCKDIIDELQVLLYYTRNKKDEALSVINSNENLKQYLTNSTINYKEIFSDFQSKINEHLSFIEEVKNFDDERKSMVKSFLDSKGLDKIFSLISKKTNSQLYKLNNQSVYATSNEKMLDTLLDSENIDYKTTKDICDLLSKVSNPEIFYSKVRAIQKYCKDDSILNAYNVAVAKKNKNRNDEDIDR